MSLLPPYVRNLSASPLAKRFLWTALWSMVGESLSKGLMLLSMVLVARILGKEGFGEFGMVRTTINLLAAFGGMGLGLTANRYVAQFRDTDKRYSGQIIGSSYVVAAGFGLVIGISMFAAAGYLARSVLASPQLEGGLRLAGFVAFLSAISGAQIGILQGLEAYRRLALGSLLQGLAALSTFGGGAYYFGLDGALTGFLANAVVGVWFFHILLKSELQRQGIPIVYRDLNRILPILWRFSLPVALMAIAVAPFKWLTEAMLAKGSSFQDLGVFLAAMTVASIFVSLVSTINAPLISLVANQQSSSSADKIRYLNLYGSWYLFLLLAAPFVLFPRLPLFLFGESYDTPQFFVVSQLLLLHCGLLLYYQGVMRLVTQKGSMWFGLITNLCEGLSLLVGFFLLQGRGAIGLGIAYVASYLVRIVVFTPLLFRGEIISPALLFDRYFAVTAAAFTGIVAFQVRGIV